MRHHYVPAGLFVMALCSIHACGSGDRAEDTSTVKPIAWTTVASILKKSCVGDGSGCHNQTIQNGGLNFATISEKQFFETASLGRIQNDELPMPPPAGGEQNPQGITLSEDDRLTLVKYLSQ